MSRRRGYPDLSGSTTKKITCFLVSPLRLYVGAPANTWLKVQVQAKLILLKQQVTKKGFQMISIHKLFLLFVLQLSGRLKDSFECSKSPEAGREAAKKVLLLMFWPLRGGGGGKGRAIKEKRAFLKLLFLFCC